MVSSVSARRSDWADGLLWSWGRSRTGDEGLGSVSVYLRNLDRNSGEKLCLPCCGPAYSSLAEMFKSESKPGLTAVMPGYRLELEKRCEASYFRSFAGSKTFRVDSVQKSRSSFKPSGINKKSGFWRTDEVIHKKVGMRNESAHRNVRNFLRELFRICSCVINIDIDVCLDTITTDFDLLRSWRKERLLAGPALVVEITTSSRSHRRLKTYRCYTMTEQRIVCFS